MYSTLRNEAPLSVLMCPAGKTLAIEPSKGFQELKDPFNDSKILFREPNKVTHGAHRTCKGS